MDQTVLKKLKTFQENQKIPHILFHGGTTGYEKEHLVSTFINSIYSYDRKQLKTNVLIVNCSGKGIKFIRDEIKTFAKMHLSTTSQQHLPSVEEGVKQGFKTVVLLNADFLTEDAQSALRRSIELFSGNTRFFMIVENKYKLLKPILSRFCEIYIPNRFVTPSASIPSVGTSIQQHLLQNEAANRNTPMEQAMCLYENGYSSYDLADLIEQTEPDVERRTLTLFFFHKIKAEYRCEKFLMATLLDFWRLDPTRSYERVKNMTTTI